ncbi:glycoside hydrolase family 43 protein [Martelella radicis]|uniref:Xylan 1,4-beta-xylosidase n=1 Tax=Martelella radicis TaxID=1397476 RepID=A0A7W6P9K1_9HYPH|nr:glycoside hydrolase family 43 protein [Martelella radicis]MBB4120609.1 xylan 1,4-beta-xylosidase [Martelella radicis]
MSIINPVLRGFNPDPSLCRVGDDYYMATSTFEWFPGVQIHHSTDLANWTLVSRPLDSARLLDMRGNPDSGGIWAPALSWSDGLFWLIYTNVRRLDGNYKDAPNFLTTAPDLKGPWSDPVYLNASGFDPSLFHDDDGRKWLVNMLWDHRSTMEHRRFAGSNFNGVVLQEYDPSERKLVGSIRKIFQRSELGRTEAPHLMRRNGYYYLVTAEGGTGYNHAVTHARSRDLGGPYALHPDTHVLTTKDAPSSPLQRVGHGQAVEGPEPGTMIHSFLCSRPLPGRRSPMGRESGLAVLEWQSDGWLYLRGGGTVPPVEIDGAETSPAPFEEASDFAPGSLPSAFQWLRTPQPERILSTDARPGWLRLFGRESIGSWFEQALVARRQTEHVCSAEVELEFAPETYQQQAGLTAYYNRHQFYYAYLTLDDEGKYRVTIQQCAGGWPEGRLEYPIGEGMEIPGGHVFLRLEIDHAALQFSFRTEASQPWRKLGPELDASVLSDEGGRGEHASFTGNFVGMAAQDLSGRGHPADFRSFVYRSQC